MNFSGYKFSENIRDSLAALENGGRMPHALIVSGSDSSVRSEVAAYLAQWAVCSSDGEKPCGNCRECLGAKVRSHSDVYYAQPDTKTKNKVYSAGEIRGIIHSASIKPNQANRKVYIFEECDKKLQQVSQDMMLKLIEEPPQPIMFIMTCESAGCFLATIRSRATELRLDEKTEASETAELLAEQIVSGIIAQGEFGLMETLSKLSGRDEALEILDRVALLLMDGLSLYSGYEAKLSPDVAEKLCMKLTKGQFLELIEISRSAQEKIIQNVSLKLVSVWLCASYRRTVWQK